MRTFRAYQPHQQILLPPSLEEWLPEEHLARFLSDVVDELDLSAIYEPYEKGDGRGQPPYHPVMMVKLLLYAYCTGSPSSRKIEEATHTDIAFRVLSANQHPDHASIAEFRSRHLEALAGLFVQVLRLCQEAGLVKLGHVAIDGSKLKANASRHKAMSYERMCSTQKRLEEEVRLLEQTRELLETASRVDQEEDERYGAGHKANELPQELARRESRLKVIREAKKALEQQAREKARQENEDKRARIEEIERLEEETGKKARGRKPQLKNLEEVVPEDKAQRNFTDPQSRIMVDGATKSFLQGYNAQLAVDAKAQVIVACAVTEEANDKQQLAPMLERVEQNTGRLPQQASADSGYCSEATLTHSSLAEVELFIAVDRQKHSDPDALLLIYAAVDQNPLEGKALEGKALEGKALEGKALEGKALEQKEGESRDGASRSVVEQMREKLKSAAGKAAYALRKSTVEPVFGQIKGIRGFRQFLFRGLSKVQREWELICLTHNLLKLFASRRSQLTRGAVTLKGT